MSKAQISPQQAANLYVFEMVVRRCSFTQAAAELHLTQSAVSQRISTLEKALGFALLKRGASSFELTAHGRELYQTLAPLYERMGDTIDMLHRKAEEPTLTISCSPSLALEWLTPRQAALTQALDGVCVRIVAEHDAPKIRQMAAKNINVAIRYDDGRHDDFHVEEIAEEILMPVCAPAYLTLHQNGAMPDMLANMTLLHDSEPWDGAAENEEWRRWLETQGLAPELALGGHFANLAQVSIRSALCGQGVALGRSMLVYEHLRAGTLAPLAPDAAAPIGAAYRVLTPVAPAPHSPEAKLIGWLRREMALSLTAFHDNYPARCGRLLAAQ
ncbi:LysR substrate-binding domain-containing protein [Marinicaulis aureus]|uniref:LysR substrate-binding domain-containing protein n=1 Tax=Hyphococcus aureus TaxID=2666033 RepID=A0ABW1KZY3_9PROT